MSIFSMMGEELDSGLVYSSLVKSERTKLFAVGKEKVERNMEKIWLLLSCLADDLTDLSYLLLLVSAPWHVVCS